ncbi:MAG: hypothetical protein FJ276_12505, partial [Planctomycetes bacterium]|nr:hypothetical protein [Planctomycetota bacterium]
MNEVLFHYEKIDPTTWVYLASLLIVGLFFKFGRFWSVRNLDLILLILLAPGLLLVFNGREIQQQTRQAANRHSRDVRAPAAAPAAAKISQGNVGIDGKTDASREGSGNERNDPATSGRNVAESAPPSSSENATKGEAIERIGFIWLLMAGALLLVRLLIDPTMVRRPLLEPNLTTGGLTFSCCSLFVFLMANVIASQPTPDDLRGPRSAEQLMARRTSEDLERHGPGYALVFMLPSLPTVAESPHVSPLPGPDLHERMGRWQYRPDARKPAVTIVAEYLDMSDDDTVRLRRQDGTELTVPWEDLSDPDRAFVRKIKAYTAIAKLVAILSQLA